MVAASKMRKAQQHALAGRPYAGLMNKVLVSLQKRNPGAARDPLEEALRLNPDDTRALELLFVTFQAQGQIGAGIKRIQEYAATRPDSARVQQYLGILLSGVHVTLPR